MAGGGVDPAITGRLGDARLLAGVYARGADDLRPDDLTGRVLITRRTTCGVRGRLARVARLRFGHPATVLNRAHGGVV